MANWCNWCSCSCSQSVGRFLAYLTDLVMAIFVTTLTATLLPMQYDRVVGVSNELSFVALLIDLLAVLHLGSTWSSVLDGSELVELPKLRLWFISTGLIFGFYHWDEEYRCAFITVLLIYYFISLLVTHTLKKAAANNNVVVADADGETLHANHELKEVKACKPEAVMNAELVEVALNDSGAAVSAAAAVKPEGESLELKAGAP